MPSQRELQQKKKKKLTFLWVLLVFIPAIAAGIIVFSLSSQKLSEERVSSVVLAFSDQAEITLSDSAQIDLCVRAVANGKIIRESAKELSEYTSVSVRMSDLFSELNYQFYLSESFSDCLYKDEKGTLYAMSAEGARGILLSDAFAAVYQNTPPALRFTIGETENELRAGGSWTYLRADDSPKQVSLSPYTLNLVCKGEPFTLALPGDANESGVRVSEGDTLLFEGSLFDFSSFTLSHDALLTVSVSAHFAQSTHPRAFGEAEYLFYLNWDVPATAVLSSDSCAQGDFVRLCLCNTQEDFQVSCDFLSQPITLSLSGPERIALLPVPADTAPNNYEIRVTGAESFTLSLAVTEKAFPSEVLDPASLSTNAETYNAAYNEFVTLMQSLNEKSSPSVLWNGIFSSPIRDGAPWISIRYGTLLTVGDRTLRRLGTNFVEPENTDVLAAGNGRVLFAGQTALFGNTVILDHGSGLISVYGHLAQIAETVRVDATAAREQVLGKVGSTGLVSGTCAQFCVFLHGFPVNPTLLSSTFFTVA